MGIRLQPHPEGVTLSVRLTVDPQDLAALTTPLEIFAATRLVLFLIASRGLILVTLAARGVALGSVPSVAAGPGSPWLRGDAASYLALAGDGYWFDPISHAGSAALLPFYPLLIAALGSVVGSPGFAAAFLSNLAFAGALIVLYRLISERFSRSTATYASLLIAILPYSFLYTAAFPWSLVLLLAVTALWAEGRRQPGLAAGVATLAALTHPLGLAIWLALAVSRGWRFGQMVRTLGVVRGGMAILARPSVYLSLALVPLAEAAFAYYLRRGVGLPTATVITTILGASRFLAAPAGDLNGGTVSGWLALISGLVLALAALLTIPRVARTFGLPAAVYVVGLLGLAAFSPLGLGATMVLAFPSVVVVADLIRGALAKTLVGSASALLLIGLTALFVAGYPVAASGPLVQIRTPAERILTNFDLAFPRQHLGDPPPRERFLTFDNSVVVLGDRQPNARYAPGETIPLRYYLYVLQSTDRGYLISARLRDAQGKQVAQFDKVLWGRADAPLLTETTSSALTTGNYLQDNLDVRLGPDFPVGIYTLDVLVFRTPTFERLPLTRADGGTVDALAEDQIVVAGPADLGTEATLTVSHPLRASVGDTLELLGDDVARASSASGSVNVALYWEALAVPDRDYTVFVQAIDSAGRVVAQSDSYPAAGGFPTSRLAPGQVIRDVHQLTIPSGQTRSLSLIVGMYDVATMQRLPIRPNGSGGPADHVELGSLDASGG